MKYTAEQYLDRIENKRLNSTPLYSRKEMIDFAEKYAKQLTLTDVSQQRELLMATLTSRVLTIQNEPDGIVRETMINNLLIDINCG